MVRRRVVDVAGADRAVARRRRRRRRPENTDADANTATTRITTIAAAADGEDHVAAPPARAAELRRLGGALDTARTVASTDAVIRGAVERANQRRHTPNPGGSHGRAP